MDPGVQLTNGKGEAVDLAAPTTQVVPQGEIGSAYSGERLFWGFDNGKVFETRDLRETDFEEMLRADGKAKTLEQVLTLPLRAASHSIEPAKGDSGEAEFIRDALERPANAGGMSTPLELVIGQMTSAVLLRRAYFEKVFMVDGARVRYAKLAFRPARTCSLLRDKTDYSFKGFAQRFMRDNSYVTVAIPPQKAFVYIHGQHRDPLFGTSDLETARTLFDSKQKVRFLWYSFLENQAIPKAIAKDSKPDTGSQRKFAEKVASLKGGGVVGIGPDQDVTAFESSGRGAETFRAAMDYLSAEMAGSVLAAFTELVPAAASGRGSYALSQSQIDFFMESRVAVLHEMATTITSWVIADLCLWNFGTGAACPTFKFSPPSPDSVEQAISMLQALATANVPAPPVPREFIDLLTEKVAAYLGIDVDTVHTAIESRAEGASSPTAALQGGIDAATRLVAQARVTNGGTT